MAELAGILWAWLAPALLQGTALLALAWLCDRALARRVAPQALAALWWIALARCVLPPDLASPLSVTTSIGALTLPAAESGPSPALRGALVLAWAAGALALALGRGLRRRRLARRLEAVDPSPAWRGLIARAARTAGVAPRSARVATLAGLDGPALFGLVRPTVLLPRERLRRAPDARDRHALLHELFHLRRRDLWLDELAGTLRALLWFHPLVWVAGARLRALGELACDESVARALGRDESGAYRETLVLAARRLLRPAASDPARAFLGPRSALVQRIERLERPVAPSARGARVLSALVALLLAACVLPMAPRVDRATRLARQVLAAERSGVHQSCFVLQAAALLTAAERR